MRRPNDLLRAPRSLKRRLAALLALIARFAITSGAACAQGESPDEPAPRNGAWQQMHKKFLERASEGDIDLLFLGDSITAGWDRQDNDGQGPRQVWDRYFGPRRAANFGIGGDRTQHVLWRLDHGEVDGLRPRVVVLMIGTNNINTDPPDKVAGGVAAVVAKLREKLPETKILLLGIFPRSRTADVVRERVAAANALISRLHDGEAVTYLDIGRHFLNPDGTISPDVMPDFVHLDRKGYRIWADSMEPTLRALFEGD